MPTIAPPLGVEAKRVELFRSGSRRDSAGGVRTWTEAELDEIVAAYNSVAGSTHDAPAVPAAIQIGHTGHEAYGWLSRAYRESDRLLGDYRDVDPDFAASVNAGRYRKRSISLYTPEHPDNPTPGKWNIRHVAYVQIPAVKGMKDHTFTDSGEGFAEFSFDSPQAPEYSAGMAAIVDIFNNQRDQMIEADGVEAADKVYPRYMLDVLKSEGETSYATTADLESAMSVLYRIQDQFYEIKSWMNRLDPNSAPSAYSEEPAMPPEQTTETQTTEANQFTELQSQINQLRQDLNAAQADGATKQEQITALTNLNAAQAFQAERDRVASFVESLVKDRKVLPADKTAKIELAMSMANDTAIDFTEGDTTVKLTPRARYLNDISSGKPLWNGTDLPTSPLDAPSFSEPVGARESDFDVASVRLDRRIRSKAVEMGKDPNNTADYAEAMEALGIVF